MMSTTLQNNDQQLKVQMYGSCDSVDQENKRTQIYEDYLRKRHHQLTFYWGQYLTFFQWKGEPIIFIGPHWPMFFMAYCCFWALSITLIKRNQNNEEIPDLMFIITIVVCIIQLVSYCAVSIKNPGIANKCIIQVDSAEEFEKIPLHPKRRSQWFCQKCNLIQPPNTGHCQFCDICIYDFDHHCPWTGKCIGGNNLIEFFMFVGSTALLFSLFIVQSMNK